MSGCATGESMISIASRRTSRSGISRWHLPRRYLARNNSDGFIGPGSDHLRSSRRVREMDPNSRSPVRCDTPQRSLISQREKHAEWRPALRLRIEQPGKIERFGRYGDRGFHAPLRDAISEEVETRGASSGHSSAPPRTQHHAEEGRSPSMLAPDNWQHFKYVSVPL
jgi:hypothetical protein